MKRKWVVFVLALISIAALGTAAAGKDDVLESRWAASPVRVDGQDQDWQGVPVLTDPGSKAQYALMNDGQNLYVLFWFRDAASASTIGYTGMTIFFNADGKKSKDLGIHFYRKDLSADDLIASLQQKGQALSEEKKAEIRKQKAYSMFEADVVNKKKTPAPSDPAVQSQPPMFEAKSGQKVLIYEFRIPLSRINQAGGIGADPGKTIKVGFEWGGMTAEAMKGMMAGQTERSGMSGAGPGGVSGDINATRDDSRGVQAETNYRRDPRTRFHSLWVDVKLAVQGS